MSTNEQSPSPKSDEQARHERLCEYVFGELDEAQRLEVEAELERDPELAAEHVRLTATIDLVGEVLPPQELSQEMRATLSAAVEARTKRARFRFLRGGAMRAAAAVVVLLGGTWLLGERMAPRLETGQELASATREAEAPASQDLARDFAGGFEADEQRVHFGDEKASGPASGVTTRELGEAAKGVTSETLAGKRAAKALDDLAFSAVPAEPVLEEAFSRADVQDAERQRANRMKQEGAAPAAEPSPVAIGAYRGPSDSSPSGRAGAALAKERKARVEDAVEAQPESDADAFFLGRGVAGAPVVAQATPARDAARELEDRRVVDRTLPPGESNDARYGSRTAVTSLASLERRAVEVVEEEALEALKALGYVDDYEDETAADAPMSPEELAAWTDQLLAGCALQPGETPQALYFRWWGEHPFVRTLDDPLSTFSIDVDTASYTLARRTLRGGRLPLREQVRTEEFVNYFRADRAAPEPEEGPFAIGLESAPHLFHSDPSVEMLRVTVRGKDVEVFERQPMTLTFVVDVSGSMKGGRLDLVKWSIERLLGQLDPSDAVALVAFSDEAYLVGPMISVANRAKIDEGLASLRQGGGTNVEAGLRMGFEQAAGALAPGTVNRVILFSDGVGNLGETDGAALLAAAADQRARGIYLNTLGVGIGDHGDRFLEQLADRGDGLCRYIDSVEEAERALVHGFTSLLQPIARDVKIQVEFDPAQIQSYRQLGYENRVIADADFRKDAVDAGEVNAGHQVTALYEIVRSGTALGLERAPVTVRLRYKPPFAIDGGAAGADAAAAAEEALEIEQSLESGDLVPGFSSGSYGYRRSVLVAQFAEVLRRSVHAREDSIQVLLHEIYRLADQENDPEVVELAGLVERALRLLVKVEARESDELVDLLDELCRLHYERGVREQTAGEQGPDAKVEEASMAKQDKLEAKVRQLLVKRYAPQDIDSQQLQRLKALGYSGEDER